MLINVDPIIANAFQGTTHISTTSLTDQALGHCGSSLYASENWKKQSRLVGESSLEKNDFYPQQSSTCSLDEVLPEQERFRMEINDATLQSKENSQPHHSPKFQQEEGYRTSKRLSPI